MSHLKFDDPELIVLVNLPTHLIFHPMLKDGSSIRASQKSLPVVCVLAAAAIPLVSGGLKTVILAAVRRRTARFSDRRHQASGMWSFAL
jgi:hypothetical protein